MMQETIGIAARVIQHARRLTLGLGERCAAFTVFERHHQALLVSGVPSATRVGTIDRNCLGLSDACPACVGELAQTCA